MKCKNRVSGIVATFAALMFCAGAQADTVTNVTAESTYVVKGSASNFGDREYVGVKGIVGGNGAQYAVIGFPLSGVAGNITNAVLRIRAITVAAWDKGNLPIQVKILSEKNSDFVAGNGTTGATWTTQDGTNAWVDSAGAVAADFFAAIDATVDASATTFGGSWVNNDSYDIPLAAATVSALNALNSSGKSSALVCIQPLAGTTAELAGGGVRFATEENVALADSAPQLILDFAPRASDIKLYLIK